MDTSFQTTKNTVTEVLDGSDQCLGCSLKNNQTRPYSKSYFSGVIFVIFGFEGFLMSAAGARGGADCFFGAAMTQYPLGSLF